MPVAPSLERQAAAAVLVHPDKHTAQEIAAAEALLEIVAFVRERCEIDGEHWLWRGGINSWGNPCMRWRGSIPRAVRAFVWEDAHGNPFPKDRVNTARCDDPLCVSPACTRATSRSIFFRKVAESTNLAERGRRIAMARRAASAVPQEVVEQVRAAELPARGGKEAREALARELGVTRRAINQWRRGETRRDYTTPLGAMAADLMR